MKRTPEDDNFIRRFAAELERSYEKAKRGNMTDDEFAKSIGVERQQLKKYLLGAAMPSFRTVALAKRNHAISIPYAEVHLDQVTDPQSRKKTSSAKSVQLRVPFSIQVPSADRVKVRLKPMRARARFELRIQIERAG